MKIIKALVINLKIEALILFYNKKNISIRSIRILGIKYEVLFISKLKTIENIIDYLIYLSFSTFYIQVFNFKSPYNFILDLFLKFKLNFLGIFKISRPFFLS